MKRSVSVFGSTGSVGVNTVDLLTRQGGAEAYDVVALTGAANVELLARQARQLNAKFAVTASDNHLEALQELLSDHPCKVLCGEDGLRVVAQHETDWAMSAIVGAAGLAPTLELAKSSNTLALANK